MILMPLCFVLTFSTSQIPGLPIMMDAIRLTPDSTIGELMLHDHQIDQATVARYVNQQFEQIPHLPGVIVTGGKAEKLTLVGMISRQRFYQQVSRHFGYEVYQRRPIQVLLDAVTDMPLQLSHTCRIDVAANHAIQRPAKTILEPIVVNAADGSWRLLDVNVLLLAQAHIFALVNRLVYQQKQALQQVVSTLERERAKAEEANRLLAVQAIAIQDHNQLLEAQRRELWVKNQEIAELNQRFVRVGQLLSTQGKQAFQATLDGIDVISQVTQRIIAIGTTLSKHLETVHRTSTQTKEVSKRARYLALQVSILINQVAAELSGVSRVTSDIGNLSQQALDASGGIDETVALLKSQIGELTQLATAGSTVSQSLVYRFERTQTTLLDLDGLLEAQPQVTHSQKYMADNVPIDVLVKRVGHAKIALSELESGFGRVVNRIGYAVREEQTKDRIQQGEGSRKE
jgi:hypothetical protein